MVYGDKEKKKNRQVKKHRDEISQKKQSTFQAPDIPNPQCKEQKTIYLLLVDVGLNTPHIGLSLVVLALVGTYSLRISPHPFTIITRRVGSKLTLSLRISRDSRNDRTDSASDPVSRATNIVLNLTGGLASLALIVLAAALTDQRIVAEGVAHKLLARANELVLLAADAVLVVDGYARRGEVERAGFGACARRVTLGVSGDVLIGCGLLVNRVAWEWVS